MDDEREAGVCLVDIGGGTTDVVIYQEHTLRHSAVIPLGGNVITNDIVAGCQLMRKHAEQLKTRYGSALAQAVHEDEYLSIQGLRHRPEKEIRKFTLAQIIQARMEELMELVMREIERAGYGHKLAGGIVLTGAGSLLHHSRELTEYVTGIDTRVGFPNEQLAQGMAMEANQPTYSTAVGLMLHGMKEEETLSERSRRGRRANGKRPTTTSNNAQSNRGEGIFSVMERIFKSTVDDVID
jgi:cell division protein FtsA